jgi:hypothetical protein
LHHLVRKVSPLLVSLAGMAGVLAAVVPTAPVLAAAQTAPARRYTAMAYDAARAQVLLFGG